MDQLSPLPFDSRSQIWLRAAARAADWLDARLGRSSQLDPPLHDLGAYYKWPLFLCSLGRADLAQSVFQTVVDHFTTPDGDFRSPGAKSADPLYGLIADSYTNTWPIVAARVLDRPDIARPALECLRRRRVSSTGGFLTGPAGARPDGRQDIVTVAGCGNAFLAWGELEEAVAAGDCLLRILDLQAPGTPLFYLYIDGTGGLLRDLDLPIKFAVIQMDQPGQVYVYFGMAATYLARLFLVTREQRFLQGAQHYFAVNQKCGPAVYEGTGCCKTAWAAAILFRITGQEEYRQSVYRAADSILAAQLPDGSWGSPGDSPILCCDGTGELGYHLVQYCLELSSLST